MTFSVVARDGGTGECGVAVASCVLAVGRAAPWARAGVGVVATQSRTRRGYGPHGLAGLEAGVAPAKVLDTLLSRDAAAEHRQVAVLAAAGGGRPGPVAGAVAVHTGTGCLPVAGHLTGDGWAVQGNTLASDRVLPAMAEALVRSADGPRRPALAERLLAALVAGERAGGDLRGRQSAALLVVGGPDTVDSGAEPEDAVPVDLRVDDDADPLRTLARLLDLQRAYENDDVAALAVLAPPGPRELHTALLAARAGDAPGARAALAALREQPGWDDWLRANLVSGHMPYLAELIDRG